MSDPAAQISPSGADLDPLDHDTPPEQQEINRHDRDVARGRRIQAAA